MSEAQEALALSVSASLAPCVSVAFVFATQ